MQEPIRALEAYRRATDILTAGTSTLERKTALRTLHEPLGGRRRVNYWHPVMEKIIHMHLELCIELNQLELAQKALDHYKKITQHNNATSLQEVVIKFVTALDKKLMSGSLETDVTESSVSLFPLEEELRAAAFDADGFQETVDRKKLQPHARTTWEAYRFSLDLLKTNPKLTTLFLQTVQRCATFCEEHNRAAELRDLLRVARKHLDRVPKLIAHPSGDLRKFLIGTPDILHAYLDTWARLFRVVTAPSMRMWQEAYRLVETMNFTMTEAFPGLNPQPSQIITYFDCLAKVFWAATIGTHHYLYHAYALLHLWKRKKRQGASDSELAGRVLISSLCVSYSDAGEKERGVAQRCAQFSLGLLHHWTRLLGLKYTPTRETLLREVEKHVLPQCSELLRGFYAKVQQNLHDANFHVKLGNDVGILEKDNLYEKYISVIRVNITTAVISTVFSSHSVVKFASLCKLCGVEKFSSIEPIVLKVASTRKRSAHIDHEQEFVSFSNTESDLFTSTLSNLRNIVANVRSTYFISQDSNAHARLVQKAAAEASSERQQLLLRLELMEKRRDAHDIEKEEHRKKSFHEKQQRDAHHRQEAAKQLEKERIDRETKNKVDEENQKSKTRIQDLIKQMEQVTGKKFSELHDLTDKNSLLRAAQKQLKVEQQKVQDSAVSEVKRADFFVRAVREEEWPEIEKTWALQQGEMRQNAEERRKNQLEIQQLNQAKAEETRARLEIMSSRRLQWESERIADRRKAHESSLKKRTQEQQVMEELARGAAASQKEELPAASNAKATSASGSGMHVNESTGESTLTDSVDSAAKSKKWVASSKMRGVLPPQESDSSMNASNNAAVLNESSGTEAPTPVSAAASIKEGSEVPKAPLKWAGRAQMKGFLPPQKSN